MAIRCACIEIKQSRYRDGHGATSVTPYGTESQLSHRDNTLVEQRCICYLNPVRDDTKWRHDERSK
jgi:hypothetical protein